MTEPEQQDPPARIVVYVCPTPKCGNYYGNPTFRSDITPEIDEVKDRRVEDGRRVATHARTECPDCRARGVRVLRNAYLVTAVIPMSEVVTKYGSGNTRRNPRGVSYNRDAV